MPTQENVRLAERNAALLPQEDDGALRDILADATEALAGLLATAEAEGGEGWRALVETRDALRDLRVQGSIANALRTISGGIAGLASSSLSNSQRAALAALLNDAIRRLVEAEEAEQAGDDA